jgi:hypothetical protein
MGRALSPDAFGRSGTVNSERFVMIGNGHSSKTVAHQVGEWSLIVHQDAPCATAIGLETSRYATARAGSAG